MYLHNYPGQGMVAHKFLQSRSVISSYKEIQYHLGLMGFYGPMFSKKEILKCFDHYVPVELFSSSFFD